MTDPVDAMRGGPDDRRRGIALVVVLGLMAMLIVMGLSFAVSMRTEHRAAREASSQLGTVEMVYSGLARAMTHIQHTLSGGIPWTNFALTSGGYPFVTVAAPGGLLPREQLINWGSAPVNANADLLSHYGLWFSPAGLLNIARDETNRVRWIRVLDPRDNSAIGQYAYIVIDSTGLLDINGNHEMNPALGAAITRGPGTNVSELGLANAILRELRSGAEENLFNGRVGIGRYKPFGHVDTIADARPATMAMYPDRLSVNTPTSPFRIYHFPTNFTTYTRYPSGYWDESAGIVNRAVHLRDLASVLTNYAEVASAFDSMGATDTPSLMDNLIDYLDSSIVPRNAASFGTKPVWMMNELQIGTNYRATTVDEAPHYQLNIITRMEMFFPFIITLNAPTNYPNLTFRFKACLEGGTFVEPGSGIDIATVRKDFSTYSFTLPRQVYPQNSHLGVQPPWVGIESATFTIPPTYVAAPPARQFSTAQKIFQAIAPVTNAVAPERLVILECSIEDDQGRVVDSISPIIPEDESLKQLYPSGFVARLPFSSYFSSSFETAAYYSSWNVVDPRINWDFGAHWSELYRAVNLASLDGHPQNSFGRMNPNAHDSHGTMGERDEWFMYVRCGPMDSIGELGYLLHNSTMPWSTIDTISPPAVSGASALPVLDRFTVFTNDVRHGLVNLNVAASETEYWSKAGSYYNVAQKRAHHFYRNPLATAFHRCPIEIAPGVPPPNFAANSRISVLQATNLAAIIRDAANNSDYEDRIPYKNVSDIRYSDLYRWNQINGGQWSGFAIPSWMGKKSLIRNTHGLLGVRSSTFVVILVGQAQRTYVDPETGATRTQWLGGWRGIATLWRDPYPTPDSSGNLRNRMFIRNLRWYDEWVGGMEEMD